MNLEVTFLLDAKHFHRKNLHKSDLFPSNILSAYFKSLL